MNDEELTRLAVEQLIAEGAAFERKRQLGYEEKARLKPNLRYLKNTLNNLVSHNNRKEMATKQEALRKMLRHNNRFRSYSSSSDELRLRKITRSKDRRSDKKDSKLNQLSEVIEINSSSDEKVDIASSPDETKKFPESDDRIEISSNSDSAADNSLRESKTKKLNRKKMKRNK